MKKRRSGALTPKTALLSLVLAVGAGLAGIGYIWAKNEVWRLGAEKKKLETKLGAIQRAVADQQQVYARMTSPRALDEKVKKLNLGLVVPRPEQIIRMAEPAPQVAAKPGELKILAANDEFLKGAPE